jgi:hypothetical protein
MAENPLTRLNRKTNAPTVRAMNDFALERAIAAHFDPNPAEPRDDDPASFWRALADDLDEHSANLENHSKKTRKLAEVVRTTIITKKVAGRVVPNSTSYVQTITKKSDSPFKKV